MSRGVFRPRSGLWPAGQGILTMVTAIVFAAALLAARSRPSLLHLVPAEVVAASETARKTMRRAAEVIADARRAEGIASEGDDGNPSSAFIGAELTPLTTTLGNLEAKRLATRDAWASELTLRLYRAGLGRGDVVAAGMSGSFPGLNVALATACESLGIDLKAISSVTASSWGANQPGFTWPEIEARLVKGRVIRRATVAITLGGAGDRALDLDPDGRAQAARVASTVGRELGVAILTPADFHEAVETRLDTYRRAASGRQIALYVNIGGTEPSLGRSAAVLRLPNGFLPGVPFDLSRERGVMARFAERGVPVLTLLNVRDLALQWGLL